MLNTDTQRNRGDTIVEALLALAIATFAVGIAYATANHSLQQAITARERNQALNLIQNQITDLRIRFQKDANFNTNFGAPANDNFCLADNAPTVTNATPWIPYKNPSPSPTILNSSNYDGNCIITVPSVGTNFYINTQARPILGQDPSINSTVFQIFVRWDRLGGGTNQASLFYRPNGNG